MPVSEIINIPGTPPTYCPGCKCIVNGHFHETQAKPEPGNYSVCVYCQTLSVYAQDMSLTKVDIDSLDPELQKEVHLMLAQMRDVSNIPVNMWPKDLCPKYEEK
jgi:hypothetical protein